jgi:hypothetical protein
VLRHPFLDPAAPGIVGGERHDVGFYPDRIRAGSNRR